jgi:staphylococcal nuclease domain-containing protein 1
MLPCSSILVSQPLRFIPNDAHRRYIQKAADEDQIADIGSAMEKYKTGFGPQVSAPRSGDMYACLFDVDGCYYRGKVLKRLGDGQFEILYVDYGNTETVPSSHMKGIDPSLAALPPMATPYKPSFIKLPRESSDALDAVAELSGLVH